MARAIANYIILFLLLVLAQVLIFNHILLFGVAAPVVFIYFVIRLGMSVRFNTLITIAFLMGLCVDICSDTPGMNTLACTVMAAVKKPVLLAYTQRDEGFEEITPCISSLGIWIYSKYMITMTLIYCLLYFCIEFFAVAAFWQVMLMTMASTLLSYVLLLGIDGLIMRKRSGLA
ncbi:MAG: rod shape-determining protein MreD [Lepagella sp.]|jgi:hypothetical protein